MVSLPKKPLRGLDAYAVVNVAILVLFIVLFAGGVLVSLLLGYYGVAAAFGYAVFVFLASLVWYIWAARRGVDVPESGAVLVIFACVGTVLGLVFVVFFGFLGDDVSGLEPLRTVIALSALTLVLGFLRVAFYWALGLVLDRPIGALFDLLFGKSGDESDGTISPEEEMCDF